jgi:hypothetical protein
MKLAEELRPLEESLLSQRIRRDTARVSCLLADEFREFGASGRIFTKSEVLDLLRNEPPQSLAMQDYVCKSISDDLALVTYRTIRTAEGRAPVEALRSSLWVLRSGRWQMLFHQGTRVPTS